MKYSFEEKKHRVSVAATLIFVCILGVVYVFSGRYGGRQSDGKTDDRFEDMAETGVESDTESDTKIQGEKPELSEEMETESENQQIVVHVCGAVECPGVYMLSVNSRIKDAVDAAGGFKKGADKEYLNLAENVTDGQKIVVYTKKQTRLSEGKSPDLTEADKGSTGGGKININTASKDELMTLTGVGESKANDIIAYREQNGGFKSIEELMNIPGIKEGVYSRLSDSITVEGS